MTRADVEKITVALDATAREILARLAPRIRSQVEDSRAHAGRALTQRLKSAEDGRPTARVAAQSRSHAAALNRLDELLTWLCGPSASSLDGTLRDAREELYRLSYRLHAPLIPDEIRVKNTEPTRDNIRFVRAFPLHGLDLRQDLGGRIEQVSRQLRAVLVRAGSADTSLRAAEDLLDGWEHRTIASLTQSVGLILGDSAVWVDGEARHDLIRPEFRED